MTESEKPYKEQLQKDERAIKTIRQCRWKDAVEPFKESIFNEEPEPDSGEILTGLKATNGEIVIGWYQSPADRVSSITYWTPTDGMEGTDGKGEWSMGIHELIENIDHPDLEPIILHLEQAKEIGYLNYLPDKTNQGGEVEAECDCHNCPWSGPTDELKELMGKRTCPECNVIIKTANIPDGTD